MSSRPASLKLMYFDGRGAMEVTRTMLATAGCFPGADYEDFRYPVGLDGGKPAFPEFEEAQASGAHGSWNMSRVPLCIADGVSIGQSRAIEHYVAKAYGLMGSSLLEEARIDTLSEHAKELKDASREAKTDEEKAAWFATPAEPVLDGKAHRKLQWHLTHIEACVGDDGYSVGGKPSLADALLYGQLAEHAPGAGMGRAEPMGNKAAVDEVVAKFPKLQKILTTFGSSEGMVKWLEVRGKQNF